MAKNSLVQRLSRKLYTGLAAGLLFYSGPLACRGKDAPFEVKDNFPTIVNSSISPTTGFAPLEVAVKYECNDDNSIENYSLNAGNVSFNQITPIDTSIVFQNPETISAILSCTDNAGQTTNKNYSINVQKQDIVGPIALANYDAGGNEDVYTMNPDGTSIRRLTTDSHQDLEPAWSPDGSQIAFTSDRDGFLRVYIADVKNKTLRTLTSSIDYAKSPSWSPDGSQIAFAYKGGVGIINTDGTGLTNLVTGGDASTAPTSISFTSDGLKIFYDLYKNGDWDIYSANRDGSNPQNITNTPSYSENTPHVSQDGTRVLYETNQYGGDFSGLEVMSMNSDGTNVKRLTSTPEMEVDANWTPEGNVIFSRWNKQKNVWEIYTMDSNGQNQSNIIAEGRYATWKR